MPEKTRTSMVGKNTWAENHTEKNMDEKHIDEKTQTLMVGKNTLAENHTKFTKNKNSMVEKFTEKSQKNPTVREKIGKNGNLLQI